MSLSMPLLAKVKTRFYVVSVITLAFLCLLLVHFAYFDILLHSNTVIEPQGAADSKYLHKSRNVLQSIKPSMKYRAGEIADIAARKNVKVISNRLFDGLVQSASEHPRKRKMTDLTQDPGNNSMQVLINTWTNESYSPVHRHDEFSEAFVVLQGALAFFTFSDDGDVIKCDVLSNNHQHSDSRSHAFAAVNHAIVVEKMQWHAMTAAPSELGWPGYAVVFETSGHRYDTSRTSKTLAPFAPAYGFDGLNGDPSYFVDYLLPHCSSAPHV